MSDDPKIKAAEAALKNVEQHRHAADTANYKAERAKVLAAMHGDDEKESAKYQADHDRYRAEHAAAVKAHLDSGVTTRDIDEFAQAVADARGEAHSDAEFLVPDHGMRTVEAEAAESDAGSTYVKNKTLANKQAWDDAIQAAADARQADAVDRLAHVTAAHERTVATLKGAA